MLVAGMYFYANFAHEMAHAGCCADVYACARSCASVLCLSASGPLQDEHCVGFLGDPIYIIYIYVPLLCNWVRLRVD